MYLGNEENNVSNGFSYVIGVLMYLVLLNLNHSLKKCVPSFVFIFLFFHCSADYDTRILLKENRQQNNRFCCQNVTILLSSHNNFFVIFFYVSVHFH
jgi:hypothetical protein